jgi:hypothetical protein
MRSLIAAVQQYASVAPANIKQDVYGIRDAISGLEAVLAANGYDARSAAFGAAIARVGADAKKPGSLGDLLTIVITQEHALCG